MDYNLISPRDMSIPVIQQILQNRGITKDNIKHYLSPSDRDIPDLMLIDNLKEGAKLLVQHVQQGDKIFVQIDSDCDGYTSSALLINYLNRLFPAFVRNNIYYHVHSSKIHGIDMKAIPEDTKFVIVPDASSNEYKKHEQLRARGIDVLIIDHHQASQVSPAACVINNQLCKYPTKSLCGVAMVYKFCKYLDMLLGKDIADNFLDLVATGLISDMMDMRDVETHYLTMKGLSQIKNPFLRGMTEKQEYSIRKGGGLNPFTVSFYIVPMINAITRVGTEEEKRTLFKSMLDYEAYNEVPSTKRGCSGQMETIIEQACRICTNVKNRQTKEQNHSAEIINNLIEDYDLLDNKILVIRLEPQYAVDKALTGLVANVLASHYQRPTLVLNRVINKIEEDEIEGEIPENEQIGEKEIWSGSARNYGHSKLEDFKKFISDSGLALLAEGHPSAFGVKFDLDKIDKFIEYSNEKLKDCNFDMMYHVDLQYETPAELNSQDILDIVDYKDLWGQEVEEPLVLIKNIKLTKDNMVLRGASKNTLIITLPNPGVKVELIKFGSNEEEFNNLYSEFGCVSVDVIGTCSCSEWNGTITPQLKIQDYEIVNKQEYYF